MALLADTSALPKPEKRKAFTARDVAAVFIKCDGRCAMCSEKVKLGEYAIDHIQALDHLGAHSLDNWQLLCRPCHIVKTGKDVKASAKGRRLRGETGTAPKRKISQRSTFPTQRPLLSLPQSMKPDKAVNGFKWAKTKWPKGRKFRSSTRSKATQS